MTTLESCRGQKKYRLCERLPRSEATLPGIIHCILAMLDFVCNVDYYNRHFEGVWLIGDADPFKVSSVSN